MFLLLAHLFLSTFFPWPLLHLFRYFTLRRHHVAFFYAPIWFFYHHILSSYFSFSPPQPREIHQFRREHYYSVFQRHQFPSTCISNAVIQAPPETLSNVRIPVQWVHGTIQKQYKNHRFTIRNKPSKLRLFITFLLTLLTFSSAPLAYAIPGTNHAFVNTPSNDNQRQRSYIDTILNNTVGTRAGRDERADQDRTQSPQENLEGDQPSVAGNQATDATTSELKSSPCVFIADTDKVAHCIDSGASHPIANDLKLMQNVRKSNVNVRGIGGKTTPIQAMGTMKFRLRSDDGQVDAIVLKDVCYVPSSPYNLIPPQVLISTLKAHDYHTELAKHDDRIYIFEYNSKEKCSKPRRLTINISPNNLFVIHDNEGYKKFFRESQQYSDTWCNWCEFAGAAQLIPPEEDDDVTLAYPRQSAEKGPMQPPVPTMVEPPRESKATERELPRESTKTASTIPFNDAEIAGETIQSQPKTVEFDKERYTDHKADPTVEIIQRKKARLATIHERLGHLSFARLKLLARCGLIPRDLASVEPPVCPGCAYGKAHRKPWAYKGIKNRKPIKVATNPGEVVSVDQLISPTPGFVPTHRGKPTLKRYVGATVFVDHFSDFTYVHLMTKMNAEETVEAKLAFERVARSYGVRIQHYHADNGLFDTKLFKDYVNKANQTLSFCGVNAHHQNGKAENRIKDVTTNARTSLLHAAHRWPKAIHPSLWPAAVKHYTNLRNSLPTEYKIGAKQGKRKEPDKYVDSPISKFARTKIEPNLNHFHPFGSPVYVLENALQERHAHNKWSDRSRVGIFLCHSPQHAANVPLVLNSQTGNVSPQFHCIYDDEFATCRRDAKFQSLWQHKAKLQRPDRTPVGMDKTSDLLPTKPYRQFLQENRQASSAERPSPVDIVDPFQIPFSEGGDEAPTSEDRQEQNQDDNDRENHDIPREEPTVEPTTAVQNPDATTTRSGRQVRQPLRFDETEHSALASVIAFLHSFSPQRESQIIELYLLQPDIEAFEEPHPFALVIEHVQAYLAGSDPDTMHLEEAMKQPDRDKFIEAMRKELEDHINRKHWKVVPLKSVPKGKIPLPMVWSMKRKRDPLGFIIKYKARLCAGGHKSIESVDYWSTYSPVVSWGTVRLMLVLAIVNNWHMQSIDFVLAFPQAPVKTDIFMKPPKVPHNFLIPDLPRFTDRFNKVYKLIQNLYGLKDAGKTWYEFLRKGLLKRGWRPSQIDECLFTKDNMILVVYVDDAVLISPTKGMIQREIDSLKREYTLTDEGELQDYLGTRFRHLPDKSIELTQPRMIERVLKIVGLDPKDENIKTHDSPAASDKLLDNNPNAAPRKQHWNYRSAVGCLSYIQSMVRPDITMSVQQVARFCNNPSREHEEAVKRICRYLLRTQQKGLIMKPDLTKGLECWVDADWAGSWQARSSHDPISAHSRTGFVIRYAGCPIVWKSTMQPLIALSTTEAEYIALSTALREVIAIINLLEELKSRRFPVHSDTPRITCKTFEDNRSCIEIATNHKTRPRTKHLSVRLHHFRSHVVNKTITVQHVATTQQIADIFTKPLPRVQFMYLRDKLMNWPRALYKADDTLSFLQNSSHSVKRSHRQFVPVAAHAKPT